MTLALAHIEEEVLLKSAFSGYHKEDGSPHTFSTGT